MHHKKGKPPHARGGPKWNKLWKLGRFGRRNPDGEAFGDHRKRDAADREVADLDDYRRSASRRIFKLVRVGRLVPTGDPIEIIHHDNETETVQPQASESETLLGYLRLHDDGILSYEEITPDPDTDGDRVVESVHEILGTRYHSNIDDVFNEGLDGSTQRPPSGLRIKQNALRMVEPLLLNEIHSMSNFLANPQWKELEAPDME